MNSNTHEPARLPEASGTVCRKSFEFVSSWASSVLCCHVWLPSSLLQGLHQTEHQILLLDKYLQNSPASTLLSPVMIPNISQAALTFISLLSFFFFFFVLLQWGFFLLPRCKALCSLVLHFPHCPLPPKRCPGAKQNSHLVLNSALLAEHTFSLANALYQEATTIWDNLPNKSPFSLCTKAFKSCLTWIKSTRF